MGWQNGQWVNDAPPPPPRRETFSGAFADLMRICKVRPLTQWPGPRNAKRVGSPFKAAWGRSVLLLSKELRLVRAKDAVLQVEIEARYFRNDGFPRADARQSGPGVVLGFTHPVAGGLMYPCDRYSLWQDNVHALALALEALRAVDRYGVTKNAEQYRGWRLLAASTDAPPTREEAARIIVTEAGADYYGDDYEGIVADVLSGAQAADAVRWALKATHPDVGGKPEAFHRVQRARKALGV